MGPRLRRKNCAPSSLEPLRNGSSLTRSSSSRKSRAPASANSRRLRCANSSQVGIGNSGTQLPAHLAASRPFCDKSPTPRNTGIRSLPCNSVGADESKDRTFTASRFGAGRWTAERGSMSKVWLITGASRGLGRAFTEAVLKAGDRVVAAARNPKQLAEFESEYGENIRSVPLDVTNEDQAMAAFGGAIANFGTLDVLVNNAGYGYLCPVEDTSLADFRAQIETNLFGVIVMTKAVLPYFRERRAGHIIQITSIAGRVGPAGRAPYAAAKFGVEGFSESLYKEVGPLGIKVTIVEPGGFRTDFAGSSTKLREGRPEYDATVGATVRFQRDYDGKQPGDPEKAAAALLHIASLSDPPLRLLLGSDSYNGAEQAALQKLELDRKWKDLSNSTDYASDDFSAR